MNLPSNHRLASPDELASGPWRDLKYRTKHDPAEWLTWDERLGAPDAKSLESFYFAVPAAEEKGEALEKWPMFLPYNAKENRWDFNCGELCSGDDFRPLIEGWEWKRVSIVPYPSRRPTPAIQQAVEALEEIAKGEGPYHRDPLKHAENVIGKVVATAKAALRHLNGEVRG
jgi:hypothetical protein